jgi:N12 class adenine-specific DNA methylase/SAM-dependent methyltransferase
VGGDHPLLAQPGAGANRSAATAASRGDPGFRPDPAGLVPHGLTDRARRNLAALDTLRAVDAAGTVTDRDRERLARWTGWGALPQLFDPAHDGFTAERDELRARLTPAQWRAASASTLNAHYTDPSVIAAAWNLVKATGFDRGRVLEPGCGSGLFIGLTPPDLRARCEFVGVEVEPITAGVAQALYPEAEIRAVGFETVRDPDGSFDIAVGNVPFGKYRLHDPIFNREQLTIHNYFIHKALRLVKPGGVVCLLTSRYTLDARNPAARRAVHDAGDLLAAIRLPNQTHEAIAGAQVVTDILLFRRTDGEPRPPFTWESTITVDVDGKPARVNTWLAPDGPGVVIGALTTGRGVYGDDEVMVTAPTRGVTAALTAAIDAVTPAVAECYDPTPPAPARPAAVRVDVDDRADGELVVTPTGMLTEHTPTGPVRVTRLTKAMTARVVDLVRLRDQARTLMALQRRTPDPDVLRAWDQARARLNERYDAYTARWGPINAFETTATGGRRHTTPARFRRDPGWGLVSALEVFDPATQRATKAAIFSHWLATPERRFTGAENPADALAASLAAGRGVDPGFIADLLACDPETVVAELAAGGLIYRSHHDPQRWEPAADYLAGDVRARLRSARALAETDARYRPNVNALEAVLPEWLPAEAISARLGAVWIPASDVRQFLVDVLGADDRVTVEHAAIVGRWVITAPPWLVTSSVTATTEWGTRERSAYDLVQDALNLVPTVVYRTLDDGTRIKLEAETLAANDKKQALCERFAEWVWEDPERAARLEHVYNDRFNSTVLPTWDGSHLDHLPGLSAAFQPHPHQLDAVWRIMGSTGNVLLGHRVGAGKTAAMVIAGQQLRRAGQITKPLYVVPNHMLDQFAAELSQLYPMARVLVATRDDLSQADRRAFVARCATGDWDAVVMTHTTFGRIPVDPATERSHIEAELERFTQAAHAARESGSSRAVKEIERAAARWNTRLAELLDAATDRGNVSFEQLGVDYLFIDESHLFKGLPYVSSLPLARSQSKRATDLLLKLDWLRSRYGPKVATFATGTPIANSIAEMWVLQRFLTPDALRAQEMDAFDSWAGTFARPVTRLELAPEGGRFRLHTRIAAFDNVPELLTQFRAFCDVLPDGDQPVLAVPDLAGGRPATVVVDPTDELTDLIASFADRADRIRSRAVSPEEDNMLKVCNDGRLASLDLRLVGRHQPSGTGKLPAAADHIANLWEANRHRRYHDAHGNPSPIPGALQLVFCDKGTPTGERFNVYDELRRLLTERGMDSARVRFIHDANTDHAKARLFAACRNGDVDVLIGSTDKLATGVNVQARLIALHHLDVPWRPADIEQREGRILRQGNQNPAVQIVRYVTTASFDPYMWGTVERKARFIAQITTSLDAADSVRTVEDLDTEVVLSYAEIKAVATGNPLIREHAEVAAEVVRLTRLATNHARTQHTLPKRIRGLEQRVATLDATAERLARHDARRVDTRGDRFAYTTPDGQPFTDRTTAGTWLRDTLGRLPTGPEPWMPVGSLSGLDWEAQRRLGYPTRFEVRLTGDSDGITWSSEELWDSGPHTIVVRLERLLDRIPDQLAATRRDRDIAAEQITRGRRSLGQPFAHAARLDELTARLANLDTALTNIDTPTPAVETPGIGL